MKTLFKTALLASMLAWGVSAHAETEIIAEPLAKNVYALFGQGGTMMLIENQQNTYLVDTQFAPLSDKIAAKIQQLTQNKPIRYVINTHWHPDHVGGNANFAAKEADIMAQNNTRPMMMTAQKNIRGEVVPPYPEAALPKITFAQKLTLYADNDPINLEHIPNAHSNSDVILHLPQQNVLHMGDIFFNRRFPNIDLSVKGSIGGMIKGTERGLALANDDTKIIAGHGAVGSKADLQNYHKMLTTVAERVGKARAAGKSLEDIQKERPTREWDKDYQNELISPERFVELVYSSL